MRRWWLRIATYARPEARGLLGIAGLVLAGVAVEALGPWPLKLIVDHLLPGEPLPGPVSWIEALPGAGSSAGLLAWLAGGTVLLFLARRAIGLTKAWVQAGVGTRMVFRLGGALFDRLQQLSLRFHGRQATGDLVRRVTGDSTCVRELAMDVAVPALTATMSLVILFTIMWKLDPVLSVLAAAVALPIGALIRLLARPMTERRYAQKSLEGQLVAMAEQTMSAIPAVQAFGREEIESRRFRDLTHRTVRASLDSARSKLQFKVGTGAVTALGTAGVMVLGGLHVLEGTLTVGGLLVFLSYLASLYAPMQTLAYLASGYAGAAAGARRVLEVMDADDAVEEAPDARPLPADGGARRGHVVLEDVWFGYEAGRPVLESVSLEARPGEKVALVGATGAGKSTLVSLVPRFFDPWQGCVRMDGRDVRGVTLRSLRDRVAIVLQDPFLLPLTVGENIAYGRVEASPGEVVEAARAARAHDFIERLPNGYETVVGERGVTLSVGQRQRLSIARALLRDAPVVILDEPTSALDTETEAELLAALRRVLEGRTAFLIAHRLSTVRDADRIVVLDRGRVVESGTPGELLDTRGRYHALHRLQLAGDDGEAPRPAKTAAGEA